MGSLCPEDGGFVGGCWGSDCLRWYYHFEFPSLGERVGREGIGYEFNSDSLQSQRTVYLIEKKERNRTLFNSFMLD
jgi:hypothetical protein